jgi:hypothetical protein
MMGLRMSSIIKFNIEHRTSRTETNKELLNISNSEIALYFVRIKGYINFKYDIGLAWIDINSVLYLDYELNSDGKLMVIRWKPQKVE